MKNKIILLSALLSININAEQFVASAGKGINLSGTLIKNSISENTNNEENNEEESTIFPSSCNEIKTNNPNYETGVYRIANNGVDYNVYCDMTTHEGGWTLVAVQYEHSPVPWNQGIDPNHDPAINQGYSLNTFQLPEHTQISFGQEDARNGRFAGNTYFNFIYNTGNIPLTTITSIVNGQNFQVHRDANGYYQYHNPSTGNYLSDPNWNNTLTVQSDTTTITYAWAVSPQHFNPVSIGYAIAGQNRSAVSDNGAWMVWVR